MDVLVLGGTRFVGRAIAERAIARGHGVTLFNRGSDQAAFPAAARINGDRDVQSDVARIGGHAWDAVVDVSGYRPAQVRAVLAALGAGRPRYLYISTVSVYADPVPRGASESAPLLEVDETIPSTDPRAYGGLKVLCERELAAEYSGPLTILRPTVVIGPHDYTDRVGGSARSPPAA